jgi:hypothetical protein
MKNEAASENVFLLSCKNARFLSFSPDEQELKLIVDFLEQLLRLLAAQRLGAVIVDLKI